MSRELIDLRSDTVTLPSAGMRRAMYEAVVGDDVFGEDPTVRLLEEITAALLGKDAALFVPSGTMANQICVKVHTDPGDEVILEKDCHIFQYETGGLAFLSGVQANTVDGVNGVFTSEQILPLLREDVYYMPRSRLICVENTHNRAGGTVFPVGKSKSLAAFARGKGISMHLDGARLWNAVAATGTSPGEYCALFDSVSVCFSKGLGAPVGSAIAGETSFIEEARHYRKILGGGMRQAGVIAAGALYALEHNRERLGEDHANAGVFAEELVQEPLLEIDPETVQTNIVVIGIEKTGKMPGEILDLLSRQGVLLTRGTHMKLRAVTHMDVSTDEVRRAAGIVREVIRSCR